MQQLVGPLNLRWLWQAVLKLLGAAEMTLTAQRLALERRLAGNSAELAGPSRKLVQPIENAVRSQCARVVRENLVAIGVGPSTATSSRPSSAGQVKRVRANRAAHVQRAATARIKRDSVEPTPPECAPLPTWTVSPFAFQPLLMEIVPDFGIS